MYIIGLTKLSWSTSFPAKDDTCPMLASSCVALFLVVLILLHVPEVIAPCAEGHLALGIYTSFLSPPSLPAPLPYVKPYNDSYIFCLRA